MKPGELLSQVAQAAGFLDARTVWDAAENAPLRDQRSDPNVLKPGDKVFVPDRVAKSVVASTGKRAVFQAAIPTKDLRIRVLNASGLPIAGADCDFTVGDKQALKTDADGKVERRIVLDAAGNAPTDGGLTLAAQRLVIHLKLQPMAHEDTREGQQARLNNLGYFAGFTEPKSPAEEAQFQWAVEEFQCDHQTDLKLKVDGKIDAASPNGKATQQALVQVHGS